MAKKNAFAYAVVVLILFAGIAAAKLLSATAFLPKASSFVSKAVNALPNLVPNVQPQPLPPAYLGHYVRGRMVTSNAGNSATGVTSITAWTVYHGGSCCTLGCQVAGQGQYKVPSLGAGKSSYKQIPFVCPQVGSYCLSITVDSTSVVLESNENDNTGSISFNCLQSPNPIEQTAVSRSRKIS